MPTPTEPIKNSLGDHRLAAIIFTDVVGFSSLVEKNERHTLLLVQRDLKLIGEICRKFGGDVLKNTGDGCLAVFSSVESAVGSAIKIQRFIADARQRLPAENILHHRIGIHLGDVFLGNGDVLGNGVNIAARLLGEAEPDGICISQTVYDLVKHQRDLKAICIGARELKHIRDAVQVYRLVLNAVAGEQGDPVAAKPAHRGRPIIAAMSLLALVTIGIATWFIVRSKRSNASDVTATAFVAPVTSIASTIPATQVASTTQNVVSDRPSTEPEVNPSTILQTMQLKPDYSLDSAASWKQFRFGSREFLTTAIENDAYVMKIQSSTRRLCFWTSPWNTLGDVTVEATARIHGGPDSSWGLQLFASQGFRKLTRTMIDADGLLKVDLTRLNGVDPANRPLNPVAFYIFRNPSTHLADDFNTMVVDVHDHELSVLVNGQKTGTSWDITPLGPATLLLVIEGNQSAVATFKQLKVWFPHPAGDHPADSSVHSDTP